MHDGTQAFFGKICFLHTLFNIYWEICLCNFLACRSNTQLVFLQSEPRFGQRARHSRSAFTTPGCASSQSCHRKTPTCHCTIRSSGLNRFCNSRHRYQGTINEKECSSCRFVKIPFCCVGKVLVYLIFITRITIFSPDLSLGNQMKKIIFFPFQSICRALRAKSNGKSME